MDGDLLEIFTLWMVFVNQQCIESINPLSLDVFFFARLLFKSTAFYMSAKI